MEAFFVIDLFLFFFASSVSYRKAGTKRTAKKNAMNLDNAQADLINLFTRVGQDDQHGQGYFLLEGG